MDKLVTHTPDFKTLLQLSAPTAAVRHNLWKVRISHTRYTISTYILPDSRPKTRIFSPFVVNRTPRGMTGIPGVRSLMFFDHIVISIPSNGVQKKWCEEKYYLTVFFDLYQLDLSAVTRDNEAASMVINAFDWFVKREDPCIRKLVEFFLDPSQKVIFQSF